MSKSLERKLNKWNKLDTKLFKYRIKLIKHCIASIKKIGLPTNEQQAKAIKEFLKDYDETIGLIEEDLQSFRKYVSYYEDTK